MRVIKDEMVSCLKRSESARICRDASCFFHFKQHLPFFIWALKHRVNFKVMQNLYVFTVLVIQASVSPLYLMFVG